MYIVGVPVGVGEVEVSLNNLTVYWDYPFPQLHVEYVQYSCSVANQSESTPIQIMKISLVKASKLTT